VALNELARESAISLSSSSTWGVFQDRFPKARRFTQAHAARDHSLVNAFCEMLAYLRHNLFAQVCPGVEHGHDNACELEPFVRARIAHLLD